MAIIITKLAEETKPKRVKITKLAPGSVLDVGIDEASALTPDTAPGISTATVPPRESTRPTGELLKEQAVRELRGAVRPGFEIGGTLGGALLGGAAGGGTPASLPLSLAFAGGGKIAGGALADALLGEQPQSAAESLRRSATRGVEGIIDEGTGRLLTGGLRALKFARPGAVTKGVGDIEKSVAPIGKISAADNAVESLVARDAAQRTAKNEAFALASGDEIIPLNKVVSRIDEALGKTKAALVSPEEKVLYKQIKEGNIDGWTTTEINDLRKRMSGLARQLGKADDILGKQRVMDIRATLTDDIVEFGKVTDNPQISANIDEALRIFKEGGEGLPGTPVFQKKVVDDILKAQSKGEGAKKIRGTIKGIIANGEKAKLDVLGDALGPQGRSGLRDSVLDDIIGASDSSVDLSGLSARFKPYNLGQADSITTAKKLFSGDELEALQALERLSEFIKPSKGLIAETIKGQPLTVRALDSAIVRGKLLKQYILNPEARKIIIAASKGKVTASKVQRALATAAAIVAREKTQTVLGQPEIQ